ncbi:MAG: dipeptide epimerase [Fuerstiella sp.]|nr:dipeptide epimerase [Fuerstiella sp.]MCP4507299.1 dipeptide epimerase [Fuerstiella sp.]
MEVRLYTVGLPLAHEFRIARATTTVQRSLIVELLHDGIHGLGEVTENAFYGHSLDSMAESIHSCESILKNYIFGDPEDLWDHLQPLLQNDPFALAAIDLAAHDLYGKLQGQRTFDLLGLDWQNVPPSSYTIGIAGISEMIAKLREEPDWSIYKIKLGTSQDVEIVRQLREHTSAVFRVDANCGWTADETISNSAQLQALGVEFIEQPLRAEAPDRDHQRVFSESSLPVIADESCLVEADVRKCVGHFHGVNVKLCKCGGLTPAVRMLQQARSSGMKTMVGCMVESTVGISAAAQLLPLLDYADLDGAVLLAEDPADGVAVIDGCIRLSERFGNGAELVPQIVEKLKV